jgi:hypothetical protein
MHEHCAVDSVVHNAWGYVIQGLCGCLLKFFPQHTSTNIELRNDCFGKSMCLQDADLMTCIAKKMFKART